MNAISLEFNFADFAFVTLLHALWGDKVSMLTHIYPHNPGGKLKWPYAKSPGWQPTLCVAWCLICWFALVYKKYGHTWHKMSLLRPDVIKQHKTNKQYIITMHCQNVRVVFNFVDQFIRFRINPMQNLRLLQYVIWLINMHEKKFIC